MTRRRSIIIITVIAGIALLGFLQVEAARNLTVVLYDSKITERNDVTTTYDVTLRFQNPSILVLNTGDTKYSITINGEKIGDGKITTFTLGPVESKNVNSKFIADTKLVEKYKHSVEQNNSKLSGTSTYRLYLFAVDVPFEHEPNREQIKQFFNQ